MMNSREPRINSAAGSNGRIVVARILPESDLIEAIEKICIDNNVKSGIIVSCIGALRQAVLLNPVTVDPSAPKPDKTTDEVRSGYGDALLLKGPLQILSGQGAVITKDDNTLLVHIHATVVNEGHEVYGGHLPKGKNLIDDTAEVTIQEISGMKLSLKYDPDTSEQHLFPISE